MQPLHGVRVLDLSWLGPGCVTTWLLAELGADVIKVEPPDGSDNVRNFPPMMEGESIGHLAVDRKKRSFAVNLREEDGRDAFRAVAATADAIVEGFRPGVAERLGIGYDDLASRNASLVYCSVTGFGSGGPLEHVAAHDLNYVAQSGMLSLKSEPVLPPLQPADYLGASLAAFAVSSGIVRARASGEGMQVESSLFDGATYALVLPFAQRLALGIAPGAGEHILTGGLAAYDIYRCRDGRYLSLAALERKFWKRFCELAGLDQEADVNHHDPSLQDGLRKRIAEVLAARDRDEWLALFDGEDVCVAPVLALGEAVDHPHVRERGGVTTVRHPSLGEVEVPAGPLKIRGHEDATPAEVPQVGDATAALLLEGGVDEQVINDLAERQIIRVCDA